MKSGAEDYVLKLSMQPEELLKVLNNIKIEIEKSKKNVLEPNTYQREKINKYYLKEDLYKRAIDNSISGKHLVEELKKLNSEISFSQSAVLCACIDDYSKASAISRMEDPYLLKFAVTNIMEEIILSCCIGDVAEINNGEFLIILDFFQGAENYKATLQELCLKINNALENYLNISVSFGISELWNNVCNFNIKYAQAKKALGQKFYYGRKSIRFYTQNAELSDKTILLNFENEKMLVTNLENLNDVGAKLVIDEFFSEIYESKEYHPTKVRIAAIEILHSFIKVAKKFEVEDEFEHITSAGGENPVDMLMRAESVLDIKEWFKGVVESFVDCLSNKRLSLERPEILKLKQYISDSINEDITLEKASRIVSMSKSYLSSIFKKETGESFTDYVNRKKMEEAKELIQRYGLKTYEAADKLGFNDESYFSKLFKKFIGINPSKVGK
jgi:two-component system response regulator YesN